MLAPEAAEYREAIRQLPFVQKLLEQRLSFEWATVRMISDHPSKGTGRATPKQLLITRLERIFGSAQQRLDLVSGYFVPTRAGVDTFTALAENGVRINILTNALEATDVPIVHAGYAKHRKALLRAGIGLWEIRGAVRDAPLPRNVSRAGSAGGVPRAGGTALHAKTFAVDGSRLFVGSFNLDPRSAQLNTELGFVIESRSLAESVDEAFDTLIPEAAYELRLDARGKLYWVEDSGGRNIRHDREPGTSGWQRGLISFLARLPIEWLL